MYIFCKQREYEKGERAGRLLAYLAHIDDRPPVVVSVRVTQGNSITDPSQVASQFQQFYESLYKSQSVHTQREIQSYLNTIQFPRLNPEQVKLMDAPITIQNVTDAIAQLAKSKVPGLDGLPLEFYATYSEMLIPKLNALYQSILDTNSLPQSMQEAQIIVLPKPGKDPHYPASYDPSPYCR